MMSKPNCSELVPSRRIATIGLVALTLIIAGCSDPGGGDGGGGGYSLEPLPLAAVMGVIVVVAVALAIVRTQ